VVVSRTIPVSSYREGDDGYVTIAYTGTVVVRVRGKCTNHMYLFGVGAVRPMDKCDAAEIIKLRDFELVVEKAEPKEKPKEVVEDGDNITASAGKEDSES
jgi:hypothetical protein